MSGVRKRLRLANYDYSEEGMYFVTIVTRSRVCLFGDVMDVGAGPQMWLNDVGKMVDLIWREIPNHFTNVRLDSFIIMPNHVHGILQIYSMNVGATHASPLQSKIKSPVPRGPKRRSLGAIVGSFKSAATKRINVRCDNLNIWQRGYHDRIIRNESELFHIREYIENNPAKWDDDPENVT